MYVVTSSDSWQEHHLLSRERNGVFRAVVDVKRGCKFKFIVDGVWCVDPSKPIALEMGVENNILVPEDEEWIEVKPVDGSKWWGFINVFWSSK